MNDYYVTRQVYVSTRRGSYVIQRAADYGHPFDQVAIQRWVQMLPWSLMRPFHFHKINRKYKHDNYGLAPNFRYSCTACVHTDHCWCRHHSHRCVIVLTHVFIRLLFLIATILFIIIIIIVVVVVVIIIIVIIIIIIIIITIITIATNVVAVVVVIFDVAVLSYVFFLLLFVTAISIMMLIIVITIIIIVVAILICVFVLLLSITAVSFMMMVIIVIIAFNTPSLP